MSEAAEKDRQLLLEARDVTLKYRTPNHLVTATDRVSFRLYRGDRLVLLGPSGCGKSTLLKAVGGYLRPVGGSITLDGQPITKPGPDRMFVFQETDQLLPWKTVRQNVTFPLSVARRLNHAQATEQANRYLEKVNLTKFADAYPHTLSGGMKQRVAIARCLAMWPRIILMDEPFASLDALTRQQMQKELLQLWAENQFTMIFVTHSISEALLLGNRVILLSPHPGRVRAELDVELETKGNERDAEFRRLHRKIQEILFKDVIDYAI